MAAKKSAKIIPQNNVAMQPAKTGAKKDVMFSIQAPHAKEVYVTGSFCEWKMNVHKMGRLSQGKWSKVLSLAPGRYEYRFVMDGEWISDPECKERVDNPHGTHNSVINVQA